MNDMRRQQQAPTPALILDRISRTYSQGHRTIDVFKDLSLDVYPGEVVALVGQSGTGKSSLLHIAGLLERPTGGDVYVAGKNCTALEDNAMTRVRRLGIGFVYQFHHLLPEFSAVENVVMPQLIAGKPKADAEARARQLLDRLGLTKRAAHRPAELSGGEQQRVAIARALANQPLLLLADEPTGNLDPETADRVHAEFLALIRDEGLAALIATHNLELARSMSRVVQLRGGQLVEI
ncbi:MAG: ABC transporter ATP-binding protein [Anderseniella sp.]|jgi:lipoprotein-releasing system ATP-binding protein|nr:ABC transporter ATP-binding protein [Anderseniella sp.]